MTREVQVLECDGSCCTNWDIPELQLVGIPAIQLENEKWQCSKWDPVTRLCTIYDQRPDVCKEWVPANSKWPCYICGGKGIPIKKDNVKEDEY